MRCFYCRKGETRVIDSRDTADRVSIRRRRECLECRRRFTTYERVEEIPLMVVKKDGRREPYDRQKLLNGIRRACEKRPISQEALEAAVNGIEKGVENHAGREVSSREIGQLVMERLHELDEVAYVRFASVYRQFQDVTQFVQEAQRIRRRTLGRRFFPGGET